MNGLMNNPTNQPESQGDQVKHELASLLNSESEDYLMQVENIQFQFDLNAIPPTRGMFVVKMSAFVLWWVLVALVVINFFHVVPGLHAAIALNAATWPLDIALFSMPWLIQRTAAAVRKRGLQDVAWFVDRVAGDGYPEMFVESVFSDSFEAPAIELVCAWGDGEYQRTVELDPEQQAVNAQIIEITEQNVAEWNASVKGQFRELWLEWMQSDGLKVQPTFLGRCLRKWFASRNVLSRTSSAAI
jgi:hypothetical protein